MKLTMKMMMSHPLFVRRMFTWFLMVGLLGTGLVFVESTSWGQPAPPPLSVTPLSTTTSSPLQTPTAESTSTPVAEFRFESTIQEYEQADGKSPPPKGCTMFVGSSTFRLWTTIPQDFAAIGGINRGFGGSKVPEVTFVMDRIITPYEPANIVFFCGGNDIAGGTESDKVFADFQEFLKRLWAKHPQCNVFFVSITLAPVREKFWDTQNQYNTKVADLAVKTDRLTFVDVRQCLVDDTGRPLESLFKPDRLHLNPDGQNAIAPVILKAVQRKVSAVP